MSNPSQLRVWCGGALAAFIDGFIDGCPVGAPAGAGIAVADGKFPTTATWPAILVGVGHILAVPVLSGISDVRSWKKDNPFPNIFVKAPAATPQPQPSAPSTP